MPTRICSYSTTHRLSSGMDEMHCARLEFAKIVSSLSSSFSSLLFVSFPPLQLRLDFYENDREPDFILSSSLPTANHQRNRTQRSTAHSYGRNRQARGESEARQSSRDLLPSLSSSRAHPDFFSPPSRRSSWDGSFLRLDQAASSSESTRSILFSTLVPSTSSRSRGTPSRDSLTLQSSFASPLF